METYKSNKSLPILNEAVAEYISSSTDTVLEQNSVSFTDFIEDKILVIKSIRRGISFKLFKAILSFSPFTEEEWAEYLNISSKSLQRYRKTNGFHFKPIHSEKILEIAEVTAFGKEVFQDSAQFYDWLNTRSLALNHLTPAELLKDSYGKELVMAELNRIDHGIFA